MTAASDPLDDFLEQVGEVIRAYFDNRGYEHADVWADDLHKRIGDILEESPYRLISSDRWERVRAFASAATTVERHKREVFARDKFVHEEVEAMNARLQPIYAELTAGYDALQPGDLDEGADHQ